MNGLCGIWRCIQMDVLHKYYIVKLYNIMNDKKTGNPRRIDICTSPKQASGPRHWHLPVKLCDHKLSISLWHIASKVLAITISMLIDMAKNDR